MGILLSFADIVVLRALRPVNNCFLVYYSAVELMNASLLVVRVKWFGANHSGGSFKIWSARFVVQTCHWKAGSWRSFLLIIWHFASIFSITWYVWVFQLVSEFLSVVITLWASGQSVFPWKEGNLGASYITILV